MTEVTNLVLLLRDKIMANDEFKLLLENHRIPIEKVALVEEWNEGLNFDGIPYAERLNEPLRLGKYNSFRSFRTYIFGGPDDCLKAIFRDCRNGHHILLGFVFKSKFTMPQKKKAQNKRRISDKEVQSFFGFRARRREL